jgi:UrcA family protein
MRTILLATALVLAPLCAFAADPESITIKDSDSDLKSEESLAALMTRIEDAANTVCKRVPHNMPLAAGARPMCRRTAVREAISEADIEALSAYYAETKSPARREMSATLASR